MATATSEAVIDNVVIRETARARIENFTSYAQNVSFDMPYFHVSKGSVFECGSAPQLRTRSSRGLVAQHVNLLPSPTRFDLNDHRTAVRSSSYQYRVVTDNVRRALKTPGKQS